nr:pilus assembly protein [Actinomycetota bacterium]
MKLLTLRNKGSTNSGQTLVEFALILPVFLLMLLGLFDLGRAIYAYSTISNATREASRLGIVDQVEDHIRQEALDASVSLNVDPSQIEVEFLSPAETGPCNMAGSMYGCITVVTIDYSFGAVTPGVTATVGDITLTATTHTPVETKCLDPATCPLGD